jgi:uncharacterized membrane protein
MSRVERWVARVLFAGGLLGVALMTVGVVGSALWTERGSRADPIVSLRQIVSSLSHRPPDSLGIAALGIVLLLVTPLSAVIIAGVMFALDGDRRFVTISAVIVAILILSTWLGSA